MLFFRDEIETAFEFEATGLDEGRNAQKSADFTTTLLLVDHVAKQDTNVSTRDGIGHDVFQTVSLHLEQLEDFLCLREVEP